jgi:hypothetical protein
LWEKDTDPILLDKIDLAYDYILEDESLVDNLSWIYKETQDLSSVPLSQMETQKQLHHNCRFSLVMLALVPKGIVLGIIVVMHETRDWTWRHYLF